MTNPLPIVSIVVPAYNHAGYLKEAIDSVLAQDYPAIELIVLNDGSTDDTEGVLRSYPAGRFYWETHTNRGQAATLNKGWEMSRGTILSYLSADDVLHPRAVSRAVEHLERRPELVMTYCDFDLISPTSQPVRRVQAPDFHYREMVVHGVCQPGPGVFFRREAFMQAGPWSTSYRQMPDYEFWLRLGLVGPFYRIPEALAGFRVHPQSQTYAASSVKKSTEPVRIMATYFRRIDLPEEISRVKREAVSNAHFISAQLHWRSGRYAAGLKMARRALRLHPRSLVTPHTGRIVLSAVFSRVRHAVIKQLRSFTSKS
jgi:glycosyltransferase involved in cell wall biosynthesis